MIKISLILPQVNKINDELKLSYKDYDLKPVIATRILALTTPLEEEKVHVF